MASLRARFSTESWTEVRGAAGHAAFIALLGVIASHFGAFDQIDRAIFTKANELYSAAFPRTTDSALVFEIDQKVFENETTFDGTTPLDRKSLASIIAMLAAANRPLAIDLDLSPRGERLSAFAALSEHAPLTCGDERLAEWPVERALCDVMKERVVVLVPFSVDGHARALAKFRWMKFVCQTPRAELAFADIPASNGSHVVEYFRGPRTLAGALMHQGNDGLCAEVRGHSAAELPVAFSFLDSSVAAAFPDGAPGQTKRPAAYGEKFLNFTLQPRTASVAACPPCVTNPTAWSALFLGGSWESHGADEFMSPLGSIPGVHLHALATGPEVPDIRSWGYWGELLTLFTEVAVGTVLILAFRKQWEKADAALAELVSPSTHGTAWMRALLVYVGRLLAVPLVVAGVALAILGLAAAIFSAYLWAAPTALLLSLVVKAYLEYLPRELAARSRGPRLPARERAQPFTKTWALSYLPHWLIVGWALSLMVR